MVAGCSRSHVAQLLPTRCCVVNTTMRAPAHTSDPLGARSTAPRQRRDEQRTRQVQLTVVTLLLQHGQRAVPLLSIQSWRTERSLSKRTDSPASWPGCPTSSSYRTRNRRENSGLVQTSVLSLY